MTTNERELCAALHACVTCLMHDGVPTDPNHPKRQAVDAAHQAFSNLAVANVYAHTCHWPGCDTPVPPRMWGCRNHWFQLPKSIRDRIWQTYLPGQEITKTPSLAYIEAARAALAWIASRPQ